MHLTVGYLATPTGDDGVALAGALARTFDADLDVVLVVAKSSPMATPARRVPAVLIQRGEKWIGAAISSLAVSGRVAKELRRCLSGDPTRNP